ncbi:MAG: DUF4294 domain-containing protein [Paludibacter sp.]
MMSFPTKYKSRIIAAITTVFIQLLLFGLLSLEFSGEQSSSLSNAELDDLELQLENTTPDDIQLTSPGKDPFTDQKDKSSESLSKEKGALKPQQTERSAAEQEAQAQDIPDTLVVPKPEIVQSVKKDSLEQVARDSVINTQIAQLQKALTRPDANNQRYQKEREKYQYYAKNYVNIRNFRKVYPYALKTREIIENLNKQLSTMTNESDQKKLIRETEKTLFKEYENAVRTMTRSQGALLLKLIARETNKTGYDIIKDYKGGFSASFWYGVGKIFGTDLKTEFHKENQDSVIEEIVGKYKNNDLY